MTPPLSAVSESCDPPFVSTPSPLLISDKSLNVEYFWRYLIMIRDKFVLQECI